MRRWTGTRVRATQARMLARRTTVLPSDLASCVRTLRVACVRALAPGTSNAVQTYIRTVRTRPAPMADGGAATRRCIAARLGRSGTLARDRLHSRRGRPFRDTKAEAGHPEGPSGRGLEAQQRGSCENEP
jgi:hypothetical protein